MRSFKGFTLAEVLITLGIIGVVAAMTLPVITQKIDKQITVSKLKKSLSTMYEIVRLSEAANGEVWTWNFSEDEYDYAFTETDFFKKYFEPYIKTVGNYGGKSVQQAAYLCQNLDGARKTCATSWVILPDGSSFGMFSNAATGEAAPGGGSYMWIFLDINAMKGPNMLGKDIFMAELVRHKRVVMWGNGLSRDRLINDNLYACKKGTGQDFSGGTCGALIQADGWEIKDDYPW